MANALSDVQNTFLNLDAKYNMLRAACKTDAERADLALQYSRAEAAYQKCVGQMLADDDPEVAVLSDELQKANAVVEKSVEQMGDMSKVINGIKTAIDIGSKIVSFAFPGLKL
jgi:hypothetical protein